MFRETKALQLKISTLPLFPKIRILSLLGLLILTACSTPAQKFTATALNYGFVETTLTGSPFQHRIYANRTALQISAKKILHVYIDGDGTPWQAHYPAEDPTSRHPFILSLMVQDSAASILLGRPCYHGLNHSQFCHESVWTAKRYAAAIVNSMVSALNHWLEKHPAQKVILIGYSGGGTLAVLMADKIPVLQTVLTLAANLDVNAWSDTHGYPPLSESLNPQQQTKLPFRIQQIHLAGAEDDIVPAQIIQTFAKQQPNAVYQVFKEFDHQTGWRENWRQILAQFQFNNAQQP